MNRRKTIWGVLLLLITIIIAGCGVPRGQLRIRGEYNHIDQADFLIYSTDGGLQWVDTLHLRQGEFEYYASLSNSATYHILYPNNDELVIWAHGGDDIHIEGDAQNLAAVKVSGNEENKLYTEFRRRVVKSDSIPARQLAASFIRQHPLSDVSLYLLERHFLHAMPALPADSVQKLYQVLRKAQPRNNAVATMGGRIRQLYALNKGKAVPDFSLMTSDSVIHKLSEYRGKQLLLYFWAGWMNTSQGVQRIIQDSIKSRKDLCAISYSLDVDSASFRIARMDSTITLPTYCDYQGFQSPLVKQLGVTELPLAVLVDEKGKILKTASEISKIFR